MNERPIPSGPAMQPLPNPGGLALIGSGIGWAICGLGIWGAIRLERAKTPNAPPRESTP